MSTTPHALHPPSGLLCSYSFRSQRRRRDISVVSRYENVLIQKDLLHENYPEYMIVELSWEYIDNGVNKNKTPIFPNL